MSGINAKQKSSRDDLPSLMWWVAINGPSAAVSPMPLPRPPLLQVTPRPEQLIGYPTQERQLEAQDLLLNASMEEVESYMREMVPKLIREGEIRYYRIETSDPHTPGITAWRVTKSAL